MNSSRNQLIFIGINLSKLFLMIKSNTSPTWWNRVSGHMTRIGAHAWQQIGARMESDIGYFRNIVNVKSSTPPAAPEDGNSAW